MDDNIEEFNEYVGSDLQLPKNENIIVLYAGNLEIKDKNYSTVYNLNKAIVYFSFSSKPKIYFSGDVVNKDFFSNFNSQEFYISIPDFIPTKILITDQIYSSDNGQSLSGIILNKIESCEKEIEKLYFYIINFDDYIGKCVRYNNNYYLGRINLNYDIWKITIDKDPYHKEIYTKLKRFGMYEITHLGVIERNDKKLFKPKDVDFLLNTLFWLLSFACGRYVGLDVQYGFKNGCCVWKRIIDYKVSNWSNNVTWFSKHHVGILEDIFPLFLDKLNNYFWKDILTMAIDLYIHSIESDFIDESFIWVSTVLELLSWIKFTQEEQIISKEKFDKLLEADKIRLLLHDYGIPIKLPFDINSNKYQDGPHLFVEIRNSIVHPMKKEKVKDLSFNDKWKAHLLGLWYLELIILNIMGYDGKYVNRLKLIDHNLYEGNVEMVPWSKK
ncbi:hypothetical protein EDC21_12321 [Thermohydrogenium kirishiense]|nr:hypothetical protein EDC21_12321 [Thermohydrogenium kirishiense]